MVIHYEEALYQVHAPLPLPLTFLCGWCLFPALRRQVESNVEHGQAAVLRRTIAAEQTTHGDAPGLPIQVTAVVLD